MDYSDQVKRTEAGGPELDPTTTAQVVELEEGPRLLTNLLGVGGEGGGQGGGGRDHSRGSG